MADLFDIKLRALRRDRAARLGPELFLAERLFADCLDRLQALGRRFERALLIGCPDPQWPERLGLLASAVEVMDPGPLLAAAAGGTRIVEDQWEPPGARFDLVVAIGTLDTVSDLPLALRKIRAAVAAEGLFLGVIAGGNSLPALRSAMRAADLIQGAATARVHPRIEPAMLAPLLAAAGFINPVVDVDRVQLLYPSLERLVDDLRRMGATNVLADRPPSIGRAGRAAAIGAFAAAAGDDQRTVESVEFLHFAAWSPIHG